MARMKTPESGGPGLLFLLVVLVVVGFVAAKFFGFAPPFGNQAKPVPQDEPPPATENAPAPGPQASSVPQVLIYHAHTTENYADSPQAHANRKAGDIVEVGRELKRALEAKGIRTIHIETVHDTTYDEAFANALQSITEVLGGNDGIKVVLDLHRDAVPSTREDGYTTAVVNGTPVAKVLLAVGNDSNPLALDNVAFAEALRDKMNQLYPGVMRGVKTFNANYNGQVHPNSAVVYVGDYRDNTLEEAKAAARLLADAIAALLQEGALKQAALPAMATQAEYP